MSIPKKQSTSRILGLDYGSHRIGVAVSDPLRITAQGLATLQVRDEESTFKHLQEIISQLKVDKIVVGMPLNLKGQKGSAAEEVTMFIERLRARFGLPVVEWDERFSSAEAKRILRDCQQQPSKMKDKVNQIAAMLILQSYLKRTSQEENEK